MMLFANGCLGSDGDEGRRDVVSKKRAIFLVWERIGVYEDTTRRSIFSRYTMLWKS
jgi:hypothetical protein